MSVVTIVVRRSSGENRPAKLGRFSVPAAFFCCPDRRFRQERPDDDQRQGRDQARHERVAPGRMRAADFARGTTRNSGHHDRRQASRRSDWPPGRRCRPAGRRSTRTPACSRARARAARVGKQLRQPGDRGDELDAHADERGASAGPSSIDMFGREAGEEGRERVEQDAPGEHAAAAEPVGQVAAERPKMPPAMAGTQNIRARHVLNSCAARAAMRQQLRQRRRQDQRQHQQLVDVEREADGGDDQDQPDRGT